MWLALLIAIGCGRDANEATTSGRAASPSTTPQAQAPTVKAPATPGSAADPAAHVAPASTQATSTAKLRGGWWPAHSLAAPTIAGPFDALVRLDAPQLASRELDDALRPTTAALRALPGVSMVATVARHGAANLLVRFADDVSASKGAETLDIGFASAKTDAVGRITRSIIPRGLHTKLAISWIGATDATTTTAWAESILVPALLRTPQALLSDVIGATRPVVDLFVQTPALPRYGVAILELAQAIRAALKAAALADGETTAAAASKTTIDALLRATTLPRHSQPNGAETPPTLADLVSTGHGTGDDTQRAWTGTRQVLVARASGRVAPETTAMQQARAAFERNLKALGRPGDEFFVHSIHAMARYRVRPAPNRATESPEALAKRLKQLLLDGQAHDVLLIEGVDGIPCELDPHCHDGRVFTMWIAAAGGRERPGALPILRGTLEPGGWQIHALHDSWDVGFGWLIDDDATFAAVSAGKDGAQTSAVARAITERLVRTPAFSNVRAGPKPTTPSGAVAMVAQAAAVTKRVPAEELALAVDLLGGSVPMGVLQNATIRLALPPGVMAAEHGRLVLAGHDGLVTLSSLLQTAGTSAEPVLMRLDGRPALYSAVDSDGEASWVLADHGHQDVERVVEPSADLSVLPLILGQTPLSTYGGR